MARVKGKGSDTRLLGKRDFFGRLQPTLKISWCGNKYFFHADREGENE